MSTRRTCGWCGVTLDQRALYLTGDYGDGRAWQCRSGRACAKRWTARMMAATAPAARPA
jgi:hypothetical protein